MGAGLAGEAGWCACRVVLFCGCRKREKERGRGSVRVRTVAVEEPVERAGQLERVWRVLPVLWILPVLQVLQVLQVRGLAGLACRTSRQAGRVMQAGMPAMNGILSGKTETDGLAGTAGRNSVMSCVKGWEGEEKS